MRPKNLLSFIICDGLLYNQQLLRNLCLLFKATVKSVYGFLNFRQEFISPNCHNIGTVLLFRRKSGYAILKMLKSI